MGNCYASTLLVLRDSSFRKDKAAIPPIGSEATNFVRACEAIQAFLATGGKMFPDDRDLIEFSARDLLRVMKLA